MSYTKTYVVSGIVNNKQYVTLLTTGNSRSAVKKFLIHVAPDLIASSPKIEKETENDELKFKIYKVGDDVKINVMKINPSPDFMYISVENLEDSET